MFNKIKNLAESLSLEKVGSYTQVKNARKTLQEIKIESQKLRNLVMEEFKKAPKKTKQAKPEKQVKEIEEPVLVDDEDYFAK